MAEAKIGGPVRFLDLLLDYFADGTGWTQGDLDDGHGQRCLVGAIHHLRRKHQIPSGEAEGLLQEALPREHCHLALFNDRCANVAELRALIANARTLAVATAEAQARGSGAARGLADTDETQTPRGSERGGRRRALNLRTRASRRVTPRGDWLMARRQLCTVKRWKSAGCKLGRTEAVLAPDPVGVLAR